MKTRLTWSILDTVRACDSKQFTAYICDYLEECDWDFFLTEETRLQLDVSKYGWDRPHRPLKTRSVSIEVAVLNAMRSAKPDKAAEILDGVRRAVSRAEDRYRKGIKSKAASRA